VEAEIEVEEVLESFTSDFAHSTLADIGNDGIEKFSEKSCTDTRDSICTQGQNWILVTRYGRIYIWEG